jgi:hypothetical protein
VQHDFARATQVVFYVMAGIMVATYILAHIWLPRDRVVDPSAEAAEAEKAQAQAQEQPG